MTVLGGRDREQVRPRLLDLFCGAGGAAVGYHRAGFEVVGVDINPQPRYPFEFLQADAMEVLDVARNGWCHPWKDHWGLCVDTFDAIHASPPCQGYANVTRWRGNHDNHAKLIEPARELLNATGLPWVMENVRTKALKPCVVLCGSMFGLPIRRHRGFETNWMGHQLASACRHRSTDLAFEHKGERAYADAMGCDWMTNREGRQAIPPAYCEYVGHALMAEINARAAA